MSNSKAVLCFAVAAFILAGCETKNVIPEAEPDSPQIEDQAGDSSDGDVTLYSFYSEGAPSVMSTGDKNRVAAINSFAFSFARRMHEHEQESYVFSPASLGCLLGMLSEGAAGESRGEICSALGFNPSDQAGINEFFRNLIVLSAPGGEGVEELKMANVAVADNGFAFIEQFKKDIAGYYDGYFKNMDFSDGKTVAAYVNDWAAEHTNGRIKKVVEEVNGLLCLVNALYFKGAWSFPFSKTLTTDELFQTAVGGNRSVKMMHMTDDALGAVRYCDRGTYRMVNLSYGDPSGKERRYSLSIMLPGSGSSVEKILAGLDAESWTASQDALGSAYVKLSLPSFSTDSEVGGRSLRDMLEDMGIKKIFDPALADFSNLTEADGLVVNEMRHLANISLDEEGTQAAAISYGSVEVTSLPPEATPEYIEFNCNRPFVYAISDSSTGAILCLGCYR